MKAQISMWEEKIVDSFAGGGGASTGIELATGRVVDIAINHDPDAILMHKTNHPHTVHYQASPRIRLSTGFPPFALLKCLQSGEAHKRPTGLPPVISRGSTSHTLA